MGNILALTAITLGTTATDLCGRALAENSFVNLDHNSLSGTCSGTLTDSLGLSGGLDVTTLPSGGTEVGFLPFVPISTTAVPEPGTFLLFGFGLTALFALRKKVFAAA